MARHTIFCNHYQAMSDHKECKAGVAYESLKGIPYEARPCFCRSGKEPNGGCHLMEMPTPEQIAEEDAYFAKRFEMAGKARQAIVDHLGGPWERGMQGAHGCIDCPVCGQPESLSFSRAGYNGHIHARCKSEDCVSWME